MDVLQVRQNVSLFPKLIVVRMQQHLVPKLRAKSNLLPKPVAGFPQATHVEIELVTILRAPRKGLDVIVRSGWRRPLLAEVREEIIVLRKEQRAVVIDVVAMKPI